MFSHGNFLILLILLKCSSLLKFLLAEDTTTLATLSTIPTTNLVDNNNSYELTNHSTTYYNDTLLTSTINPAGSVNVTSHGDEKNFHMAIQDKEKTVKRNERSQSKVTATDVPERLPQPEALFGISGGPKKSASNRGEPQQPRGHQIPPPATIPNPGLPVFPDRPDAVYFIVAVIGGAKTWGRTLARTLLDMGPPFGSSMGPPLRPIYIDLPHNGRFSVKVLTSLCQQSDGIPLAGIVVIGDGQSARAVALSGNAMKVPVLWAKGGTANIHGLQREAQTTLQAMLMPSAKEILESIRALFLQTHWYSFFILSDVGATMVLAGNEGSPLKESPLTPRILPLPAGNGDVFRQLAQISRSTRGIVLLLCDLMAARKIMTEAKRLNMAGGHFIWVWADTSSTTEFFDIHQMPPDMAEDKLTEYPQDIKSYKTDSDSDSAYGLSKHYEEFVERKMDFEDMDPMRRGKVEQKQPDRPRSRQKQQNHPKQERGPIRKPIQPVSESNGAGRYIFGLKRNHEESDEIKYFKEKRNPNEDFNEDFDEKVSNEDHYEDVTDEDGVQNDNTEGEENFFAYDENDEIIERYDDKNRKPTYKNGASLEQFKSNHMRLYDEYLTSSKSSLSPSPSSLTSLLSSSGMDGTSQSSPSSSSPYHGNRRSNDKKSIKIPVPNDPDSDDYNDYRIDDRSDNNDSRSYTNSNTNNHNHQQPPTNDSNPNTSNGKNMKPKRTSSSLPHSSTSHYFGKNQTISSHVLFHHFKDFPVGLLALRPVRMTVDRHFIRSTIRLFASTWFKVEQDAEREEEIRSKFRSNNYFVASDNLNNNNNNNNHNPYYENLNNNNPIDDNDHNNSNNNWWSRDRSRDQERITISQTHRRTNTLSNSNNHRNRKRRSSKDGNTKINNNNNNENNLNNKTSIVYNSDHTINDNSRNITNKISEKVAFSVIEQQLSSDLNGSLQESLANSSNNQNLSGLNLQKTINNESNTLNNSRNTNNTNYDSHTIKTKRYNNWWASKDRTRQRQRQMQRQQQLPTNQQFLQHQQTSYQRPMPGSERYRTGAPHYTGGCFGTPSRLDVRRSENFAKALRAATTLALSGQQLLDGSYEKPLATNFELLNLVPNENVKKGRTGAFPQDMRYDPMKSAKRQKVELTKWRRVGLISGTNVQLDTIVWPGGDIVVSGLSAHSRTVFRIVTALAPPFVMESELDEDGLCLRGLPCHRLSPSGHHNLTLMFNAIETRDRLEEDAAEHGIDPPPHDASSSYDHSMYKTKCCYGLSMDLLSNIATELSFEFHLYIVRDELFGARFYNFNEFMQTRDGSDVGSSSSSSSKNTRSSDTVRETSVKDKDQNRKENLQPGSNNNNKKVRERMQQDKGNYYSASFERKSNLNKDNAEQPLREGGIRAPYVVDWQDKKRRKDSRDHDSRDRSSEHGEDDDEGAEEDIDDEGIDVEDDDYESNQDNEDYGYQHHNHHHLLHHHRKDPKAKWNGIIGDLISGSADMSFAPLSVSRARAEAIDFSVPYFHSGVSLLAAPQSKSEIPLLAFLLPFSPELWIAIFTSLNVTAVAVAIYEWLSPFGLNPWGRQRSKNFSMSSALWVMWGLLCGHLVAFKAPKSWPNKFLINVWGGFSVIFIASYTANIAALIAGLFFHNASNRYDVSLLTQRVGAPIASAAESYIQQKDRHLWEHMKKYTLTNFEDGIRGLKNGSLDLIMADTPILDYYRATDPGCTLQKIGDTFVDDTYAVGMTKGFPLKDSISALIAKYSSNGYLDILTEKWYGGLPCFKSDIDIVQPRPLGVEAVAGVFLLLGLGVVLGILILIFEHLFYKYTLPILRHKPKGTVWKSRNIMFFSQKLYRFINCVELVSPHHAARELVHTLRQGQIASLFQKSIKRKEDEQRRRRKSKAQFFEMIQEIRRILLERRQQQEERANPTLTVVTEVDTATENQIAEGQKPKSSPKPKLLFANRKDSRVRSNSSTLNVRRFSTDSILSERLDTIGRRLSRDLTNSPPDFGRRFETFGKNSLSVSSKFDTFSGDKTTAEDIIEETKFDTYSGKGLEKPPLPVKKHLNRRTPLNSETFMSRDQEKKDQNRSKEDLKIRPLPVLKEGLVHPICQEDNTKAVLRDQLHEELRAKYGECGKQRAERRVKQKHPTQVVHKSRSTDRMQPKHNRQRSLDNLDQRPPIPSPRTSRTDNDVSQAPALPPKVSARTIKPRSLDRLDHDNDNFYSGRVTQDYFGRSKNDRKSEPP